MSALYIYIGIWSKHDNKKEDRLYKFECCNVMDILSYSFNNIIGEWIKQNEYVYKTKQGTQSTNTDIIESIFAQDLSQTVSQGFKFNKGQTISSISDERSLTVSSIILSSFSESPLIIDNEEICKKRFLFQWVMNGDEIRSDNTSGIFTTYSNNYLCTNNPNPQCLPGYCTEEEEEKSLQSLPEPKASSSLILNDYYGYYNNNNNNNKDDNNNYYFVLSHSTLIFIVGLIILSLLFNIILLYYINCNNNKNNKNRVYKKVKIADTDSEI